MGCPLDGLLSAQGGCVAPVTCAALVPKAQARTAVHKPPLKSRRWSPAPASRLVPYVQGWGSDDEGDARLDEELTRDYHFGGGLFEKKAGGGGEGEEGEDGEGRPHKKSKKEVCGIRLCLWMECTVLRIGRHKPTGAGGATLGSVASQQKPGLKADKPCMPPTHTPCHAAN